MIDQATIETDPVLLPFLYAQSEAEAEEQLTRLLENHVEPLVKNIISYKLHVYSAQVNQTPIHEVEDIYGEAIVNLFAHLTELRNGSQHDSIRNFRSYVAVTAYRAFYEHLRRKYPQRHSLKNKLRYFLRHQTGFALWEDENGELIAGFSRWQSEKTKTATNSQIQELREQLSKLERDLPRGTAQGASLQEILIAIFNWTDKPVELDSLVNVVASLRQIKEQFAVMEEDDPQSSLTNLADTRWSNTAKDLDEHSYLSKLWDEIKQLSPKHCAALLLNLRDEQQANALDLFLMTGVASFKEIATAMNQTEEWLAQVWNHLPMEDALIAQHLGLNRQQVINLRKTARLRLAKRMSELFA
jgi:DNA-directed RNA polymerase specialized sigma24 family protein